MKALVLGATGHIGNAVVREMLQRGYEITAVSRRPKPANNLTGLPVSYVTGDLENPEQLNAWLAGHEVIVDAAAPYPSRLLAAGSDAQRDPVAHAAARTRLLLDAVRTHRARLAYVGSFVTIPQRRSGLERWQADIARILHPYFAVKKLIETEILAAARDGVPAVIINPTMCIGPWDMKPRELCFIPRLLSGEAPASVGHVLNVIDVRDVAAGLVGALEAHRYGEPILLAGHNISNEALYRWVCEIGGARPPRMVAPMTLSLVAAYFAEIALSAAGRETPLPALAAMLTAQHGWFAPSAAQSDLGVFPRSLSVTLLDAIEWYRAIGYCQAPA